MGIIDKKMQKIFNDPAFKKKMTIGIIDSLIDSLPSLQEDLMISDDLEFLDSISCKLTKLVYLSNECNSHIFDHMEDLKNGRSDG